MQEFVYSKFVQAIAGQLGISLPYYCVMQEADTDDNQGTLGFDEFCAFYKMMSTRRDLYLLMLTYSNHKDYLDTDDLRRFLEIEQKVGPSQERLPVCMPFCLPFKRGGNIVVIHVKNRQFDASWFSSCRLAWLLLESSCSHYLFFL